jgi:hypothetical protein
MSCLGGQTMSMLSIKYSQPGVSIIQAKDLFDDPISMDFVRQVSYNPVS